ncbi:hypothetical protein [Microbulbifer variabilis]|uniref:hypothetical protein n=1 Tax=Microbulbifer variabilis TaxID=266805 RepID=UPI000367694D|nr:hypothetical protein [Microbulbifer variabilis]
MKILILLSALCIYFISNTASSEILNNKIKDSNFNSLKSVTERAIANSAFFSEDILQLINRSNFDFKESSESAQVHLYIDSTSASIITKKSQSNSDFLDITIRAADADYHIKLNNQKPEYIISGHGSKIDIEGKLLLCIIVGKMELKGWKKSENLYKSASYKIANWFSEMPTDMVIYTIDSIKKDNKK